MKHTGYAPDIVAGTDAAIHDAPAALAARRTDTTVGLTPNPKKTYDAMLTAS